MFSQILRKAGAGAGEVAFLQIGGVGKWLSLRWLETVGRPDDQWQEAWLPRGWAARPS